MTLHEALAFEKAYASRRRRKHYKYVVRLVVPLYSKRRLCAEAGKPLGRLLRGTRVWFCLAERRCWQAAQFVSGVHCTELAMAESQQSVPSAPPPPPLAPRRGDPSPDSPSNAAEAAADAAGMSEAAVRARVASKLTAGFEQLEALYMQVRRLSLQPSTYFRGLRAQTECICSRSGGRMVQPK